MGEELQLELDEIKKTLTNLHKALDEKLSNVIPIGGLYTPEQAQKILGVNDDTLARMRKRGKIKYKELLPRLYRYPVNQPLFNDIDEVNKMIRDSRKKNLIKQ